MSGEAIKSEKTKLNGIEDHYARDSALRYAEGYKEPQKQEDHYARDSALRYAEGYKDPQKQEDHYARDSALRYAEGYKEPQNASKMMYVAASCLNVRKGAGRKYSRLGALSHGKAVNVLEKKANGWYKISFGAGVGWVKGKYLADKSGSAQAQASAEDTSERADVKAVEADASENVGANAVSADTEAPERAEDAISDDGVAIEDGNYINKKGVKMRTSPSDEAKVVSLTVVRYKKGKPTPLTTTLKPGMVVRPTGETKEVGNDVWTKVSHTWRKTKFVGWIKNLNEVSDYKSVVGNASGKCGGTGLAKDIVSETEGKKNAASTGYCQQYVRKAAIKAAGNHYADNATDAWKKWSVSTDIGKMPVGAAVYFTSPENSEAGHVGLHRGNGMIAHQLKSVTHESLADVCKHGYRFRAWGWQGGVPLK